MLLVKRDESADATSHQVGKLVVKFRYDVGTSWRERRSGAVG